MPKISTCSNKRIKTHLTRKKDNGMKVCLFDIVADTKLRADVLGDLFAFCGFFLAD